MPTASPHTFHDSREILMRAELLHVVAVVANPIRWESRIRLAREFIAEMLDAGVRLTVVECAYGERPFDLAPPPHVNHVRVRAKSLVWNKENLINIGIARLPQDWQYVAWIDADISFRKAGWAAETVHALQQYDVVQPWSDCYDLGPDDDHLQAHRAFCRIVADGGTIAGPPYQFAHPGYAWAATRRALTDLGGLIDTAALGAGDHHMAMALLGRVDDSVDGRITAGYRAPLRVWQRRALHHIGGNIGAVPGTIEHAWHGKKESRNYVGRWSILANHDFDPATDLVRNTWGVVELAGNKPALARDIDRYFRQRDEDGNSLS
jgi:hypothetical protein